jgi:hypothetical protein
MFGTIVVFVVGVVVGAAGRNQIAEAARYVGNATYELIRKKDGADRGPN